MPWHLRMIITIFLLLIIVYVYFGFRFSRAVSNVFFISATKTRISTFSVLFLLNLFPILILLYFVSGNISHFFTLRDQLYWPDYVFLYPFWIGLIVLIEVFPYYLLIDITSIVFHIFKVSFLKSWIKWGSIFQFILPIIFIFYVGIRSYSDTSKTKIKQYLVPVKNLPAELQDLKLVLFADIQVDRYTQKQRLINLKQRINQLNSDLLLSGGDQVTYGEDFIDEGIQILCDMNASFARISCLGDHDYWSNSSKIAAGLKSCGWNFLENQHKLISYHDRKILVTGIVYIYSQKISQVKLDSLLSNAPQADLKILLVHQPAQKIIKAAKEHGYDLVLAGHTHGGQIVFKPFGFSLTPTMFENPHFSGYSDDLGIPVIITNGIGLTLAPLRYNAPAEISKISLVSE